jgi:class 3 adenylate cyclase
MEQGSPPRFSLEELLSRTGETEESLREWGSLGLIGSPEREGFDLEDVERVRLVQLCVRRGITPQAVARADKEWDGFLGHYLEFLFPNGIGPSYSLAEASSITGLDADQTRRILEAACVPDPSVVDGDLDLLRSAKHALDVGLPEEALLQLFRVYAEALGRAAEADVRLFHFYVHERLKGTGLSGLELLSATISKSTQLMPMVGPMMSYFHAKGRARAVREDLVMHLAEEGASSEQTEARAQLRLAILFVDLASFTPMTEAMGDIAAAQVVERFSEIVRDAARPWDGRVVDRIGDAFLLVLPRADWAVACALEIQRRVAAEPQFPAVRGGVHWGQILYREGGYVGSNLNLASRVANEAKRHEILVTAAARMEIDGLAGVEFVPLGKRSLKGVGEDVELFEARSNDSKVEDKVFDVVCGMEIKPAEVAARLSLDGRERSFCSEKCLRMFVAAPEKYAG